MGKWLRRIVVWTLVGTLGLVVVVAVTVGVVTNTARFRGWLRAQAVTAADGALVGNVEIGAIDGSLWSELVVRDVRITHRGEEVLVVPAVRVAWSPGALLTGRVAVTAVEVSDPLVRAVEDAEGRWGIAEALSPKPSEEERAEEVAQGEASAGLPVTVSISSVELDGGHVVVAPAGGAARTWEVERLHLDAGVELVGVGVDAALRDLSLRLTTSGAPPVDLMVAGAYHADAERTRISVERLDLTTPDSTVHLTGTVADLDALAVDATLGVERLASPEMRALLPQWPLAADVSGTLAAKGSKPDLRLAGELRAAEGRVGIEASGDLSGDAPRYTAAAALEHLDVARLLARDDLAGVFDGSVKASGTGTELAAVTADADVRAEGLRIAQASLGTLTVEAGLAAGEATVTADLVHEGRAHLETTVGIAAERYDLRLDVADLDLGSIAGAEGAQSRLELTARVRGTGFAPERMDATADVRIAPSRVGPLEIDRGVVQARVADQRAVIDTLRVEASDTVLEAEGRMGLTADAGGHVEATLRVPDVKPWLTLAGQSGQGALTLTATADGPPTALDVVAHAEALALRVGTTKVGGATIDADLSKVGGDAPAGTLRARVEGLDAGIEVASVDAAVDLEGVTPPAAHVAVDAVLAAESRRQSVRADVVYGGEEVAVDLTRLSLALPTGQWELGGPARIVRDPSRVAVDGLRLASGAQAIVAGGALGDATGPGLRVRIQQLDLASFQPLAGDQVGELAGIVDADVQVRGPLDALEPSGTLRLDGGLVEAVPLGVTVRAMRLDTRFAPDRIEVRELSAEAGKGSLRLAGDVGLEGYAPSDADLRLVLTRWPAIDTDRYQATVAADVSVRGPITGPEVGGRVQVLGAELRPDISLPGAEGPPPRDATIVVVQEREAEAAAGGETGDGGGESDVFLNTALDLEIVLERGVWVKHERSAIELQGDLEVKKPRGDPDPAVVGSISVVRGWIYLYGRRLTAGRGVVTFTGGREIDPALDVVMRARVDRYDVSTTIGGTASKPQLSFDSSPPLDDADVLAVLMFGKPANELGSGDQVAVEQQAVSIASNYAASRVAQALGEPLGFQISELDVTKGRVGVGRYVTPKTYVSVVQDQSGGGSREVQVQYYATPKWTFETSTTTEGDSGADVFWQAAY